MQASVIAWTDYISPYAFVAKAWSYELERDYDIALDWRPYSLDVANVQQPAEARDPHHWRRVRYGFMDARRFGAKQGLVMMSPKKIYDARPLNAGMLWAKRHSIVRAYNDLAFSRFWRREIDPSDTAAVEALLVESGAPSGFASFLADEGGTEHDRLRGEAEASGVFGVPTFVFDGELFWGGDRIGLLRERLDEKGVRRRKIG
jgi:2-hydroxychromene-2-carboxylate isomerase